MATAYYFAAHGAHFPMVHTEQNQPSSPPPTNRPLRVQHQTPHVPVTVPAKVERADSVVSAPGSFTNEQLASPFFRLPAELRNQIYEDLLCPGTLQRLADLATTPRLPAPSPAHTAILSTCKKIHNEAVDLLYTTHVFHAHPSLLTSLPHLMATSNPVLYPTVLSKIRRWQLTIRLDTDPRFTAQQAATAFSGCEFLDLKVWQSMFDGCNAAVLKLFTGVRGVKCARVSGSVDEGLARWLEERMMSPLEEGENGVQWCGCKGERYVKCEECGRRVQLNGNGAGLWMEEGDAWRFGNR